MVITKQEIATFVIAICFVLFLLFGFNWVS
jgi:hypothetical protein